MNTACHGDFTFGCGTDGVTDGIVFSVFSRKGVQRLGLIGRRG